MAQNEELEHTKRALRTGEEYDHEQDIYFVPHQPPAPPTYLSRNDHQAKCCCCIPLRTGCFIIGIIWIILPMKAVVKSITIFWHLDREEEEKEQKHMKFYITRVYAFYLIGALINIIVGWSIIVSTYRRIPKVLLVSSYVLPFLAFITLVSQLLIDDQLHWNWYHVFIQLVAIYSAFVLWSYSQTLRNRPPLPLSGCI